MFLDETVTVLAPGEADSNLPWPAPSTVEVYWIRLTDLANRPVWANYDCGGHLDPTDPCKMDNSTWSCVNLFANTPDGRVPDTVSYPQSIAIDVIVDADVEYLGTQSNYNGGTVSLNVLGPLEHEIVVINECNGNAGSVLMNTSGGLGVFTHDWQGHDPDSLMAGTYEVIIHEEILGWYDTVEVTINSVTGTPVGVDIVSIQGPTTGQFDGEITVTGTGGSSPYEYIWDNWDSTATTTGLGAGDYSVLIIDSNGCSADTTISLNDIDAGIFDVATPFTTQVFPNPTKDEINVILEGNYYGQITIDVVDLTGRIVKTEKISTLHKKADKSLSLKHLDNGMYIVIISAGKYVSAKHAVKN